jgi:diguanylate cyclase (GGDEF)-like protein
MLAPETDAEQARVLAERLRDLVAESTAPIGVTLSIGICAVRPERLDSEELLRLADQALYQVKRSGRNGLHVYTPADVVPGERSQSA